MKKTILSYFEQTVCENADRTAVADAERSLSYAALSALARSVGTCLARQGGQKQPIALFIRRGVCLPAAMLGVLYSGNFYVVLDEDSPRSRIEKILHTLSPRLLLYAREFTEPVQEFAGDIPLLCFEDAAETAADAALLDTVARRMTALDPAYALFTSGSTGVPKGALLTHQNVISYISWFTACFGIDRHTVFGAQTALYFSMSVSDFYGAMFTGGSYQMIPKAYFTFPAKLIPFMNERKVNTIYWVPSALGLAAKWDLLKYGLPDTLETILFAGEVMPVKYLNYWKRYLPQACYANLFGPTETTDICAYYIVNRDFSDTQSLPIGNACDNCALFSVNADGRQAAEGEIGELYVRGPFVASGYYANAEKTAEAFVQNPLQTAYPETVYKTGDLVKYNAYGELEYIGRKDFQIKHMGYRIEPSEIETVLNTVEGVELTVCVYDKASDRLLLAYESQKPMDSLLNRAAGELLPQYMRPALFRHFSVFPKNANGKIDRKQIQAAFTEKQ